ncbi:hypothetical protein A3G63_01510 [Candidatus Kaiserbacteria bacterium RIFCSPLOWO2_12_FULL_52_8]|uniref:EamA domain-containing protein n=1 Tax=Candidatus Kaiserbacteria bacterium RIFCSPHIGHO2_01_FULL_53_31 TaxID=1798481 RepID=A0A1F6CGZ3_9BACT|nr:MAG: hypothetical protein A2678_03270 [Candidatus Kaiserbacteria bacterium RIFCSPHIGHO2_01_FULL_53_31]OGG93461.1 MAG: hypothetical protein A3G63_01510 [Candidatus Kaiserbacteria bacterium RIFCSPLOWO2_12_FULL_52_8]
MDSLVVKAVLAGIFFGIWPLLMNRSGISGNSSAMVFSAVILVCVSPLAIATGGVTATANWWMAIGAGVSGAIGLLFFNSMLSRTTPQEVSALFVLAIVVQVAVPALYQIFIIEQITATKGVGFLLAAIGAALLSL